MFRTYLAKGEVSYFYPQSVRTQEEQTGGVQESPSEQDPFDDDEIIGWERPMEENSDDMCEDMETESLVEQNSDDMNEDVQWRSRVQEDLRD